ncbi:insulinase family protein, partial [Vibrio sp. 704]|uniref:insulinase family protein n=1 Tax=Vibrio sp. 704 TaxID=3074610 RepID=UPI002965BB84|nr:insulinase family protein [Vibrio sp. 704]
GLYNLSTEIKVDERQLAAVKQEFKQERSAFLESPMGTLIQVANTSAYTPDSRHRLLSSDGADTVTPERILAVHDQLFKTDHGYKMVIVADVEPEQITPLLRKYVASIKMKPGKAVDYRVSFNDKLPARSVVTDGHEPSSFYLLRFTNTDKYNRTAKDTVIEDILERISAARVLETFR